MNQRLSLLVLVITLLSVSIASSQTQSILRTAKVPHHERKILKEMRADLMQNLEDINSNIESLSICIEANKILIRHMDEQLPYNDSLEYHFANLYPYVVFSPKQSTYDHLKHAGMFTISNDSIRNAFSDLYGYKYDTYRAYENIYFVEHYTNYVKPMFIAEFESFQFYRSFKPRNYSEFIANDKYRPIILYTIDASISFRYLQSGLKEDVESLLKIIERELAE